MADRQLVLARIFRLVLAAGLFLVVTAIIWHLASRSRPGAIEAERETPIPEGKVERQEGVEHFDLRGERIIQVRAERHYAGKDDQYHLDGNVEVKEIDRKSGRERVIRGDKISYDRNWNEVVLEGRGSIQEEGLRIESSFLRYQKEPESMWTERGATFSTQKVSGQAKRLKYSVADRTFWLEEKVRVEIKNETRTEEVLIVEANSFRYSRLEGKGQAQGDVIFSFGGSHGQADSLSFEVTEDEEYLQRIELEGRARLFLMSEGVAGLTGENIPWRAAREREMAAEKIVLIGFSDTPELQSLEATGSCFLKSVAPSGAFALVRSQSMTIFFDRQGEMRDFWASGRASLEEKAADGNLERLLTGQALLVEDQGSRLTVKAGPGEQARLDSTESEVMAETMTLFLQPEVLEATEEVRVVLKPQPEKEVKRGFFGHQQPVFIHCRWVRFEKKENRYLFKDRIRLWQDKNVISADALTMEKESGEMAGEGSVRAVFVVPPKKDRKEERIEMGGAKMDYDPKTNLLTFEPESWVKMARASLNAQHLFISLAEKEAEILTIKGKGKVTVKDALREGQSEEALYDLEKETMALTGNPVVRDKNRGLVQGDKLTFSLGDDRIFVENKERERSTAFIKREQ
ncbi:MAG: LptA/OstA family protein [Candidatus Aminicenantales bacterium]